MVADSAQTIPEEVSIATPGKPEGEPESVQREQSTIVFPYADIDDAVGLARAIHGLGGLSCGVDQLAAKLAVSAAGGGFRARLSAGRIFGLISAVEKGRVSLTDLGRQVCDPAKEKKVKAAAFLNAPLYRALYERYKNGMLPPNPALEADMHEQGVSKKQTERARQIFQRSAEQANFFWSGKDRLVMPPEGNGHAPPAPRDTEPEKKRDSSGGNGSGSGGGYHPFIEGLLKTLPAPDGTWPIEKRAKWLQAASHVFDLIYADADGCIEIKVKKEGQQ